MRMREERFKARCKILIALAWLIAYLPSLIQLFEVYNINGLNCQTFFCTNVNIVKHGRPQQQLMAILGPPTISITLILLITFNLGTYLRLWVS